MSRSPVAKQASASPGQPCQSRRLLGEARHTRRGRRRHLALTTHASVQPRRRCAVPSGPQCTPTQDRPVPSPAAPGASSSQRRRFVRDGEVSVSVIHRDQDDGANTNKLDATRQALREQIEAREQAEHLPRRLRRRSATSRPNWPMSGSPGMRRFSVWSARSWLSSRPSRGCRTNWRPSGPAGRKRSRSAMAPLQPAWMPTSGCGRCWPPRHSRRRGPHRDRKRPRGRGRLMPMTEEAAGGDKVAQPRRRGRPAKSNQSEAEIVEWWKPGWRDRSR